MNDHATSEGRIVEPGRAGGSSAWPSLSSAPGRARPQAELGLSLAELPEARLGSLVCVYLLRLFDGCFVSCLFEALCISICLYEGAIFSSTSLKTEPLYLMVALLLVELKKASGGSRMEQRWS